MDHMSESKPTTEATPSDQSPAEPVAHEGELDDVKAKFLEALARKNGRHHDENAANEAREASKIHGEHGKAGGGRAFRRKSG